MAKLNPTTMKTQYDGQYDTFCRKNHDYGNSFEESLDKFGIIASLVRMQDKMLRLESLTDESKTQQVGSESLLDTLEDLSNYAAMTACWLKGVQAEDDVINKSFHAVKDVIETCDDSDVKYNESYHKRMLNSLYGAHIFRTPGENWRMTQCENGFKPLGAEIETELPEETIGMYIDRMLSELYSRIDVWGYNDQEQYHEFVNFAETTVKEMLVPADLDDDTSRIIKCISETDLEADYVVSYMEALMGNAGIPPYLREWIRGIILRGMYYNNKRRNMTKAKDKARGAVVKGGHGNGNVIVMASRGSGKGLMKTKSLLEELGVPKEDIKEIFEGLEDDDE